MHNLCGIIFVYTFSYLKTWFTLDLISSIPLHYILLAVSGQSVTLGLKGASRALKFLKVAKLLNLLKLLRLSRIIRGIARYEEVSMHFIPIPYRTKLLVGWNFSRTKIVVGQNFSQFQKRYWEWSLVKTLKNRIVISN